MEEERLEEWPVDHQAADSTSDQGRQDVDPREPRHVAVATAADRGPDPTPRHPLDQDPNVDATGWTHRVLVPRDEASNLRLSDTAYDNEVYAAYEASNTTSMTSRDAYPDVAPVPRAYDSLPATLLADGQAPSSDGQAPTTPEPTLEPESDTQFWERIEEELAEAERREQDSPRAELAMLEEIQREHAEQEAALKQDRERFGAYDANVDGNEIAGAIAWYDHAHVVEGDPHFVFVEPDDRLRDEGGRAAQLSAACTCDECVIHMPAIREAAAARARQRATMTCEPCVAGTRRTRPQPVEAMSSTEMASLPTAETRAGKASDFRSSRPAASNARSERPEVPSYVRVRPEGSGHRPPAQEDHQAREQQLPSSLCKPVLDDLQGPEWVSVDNGAYVYFNIFDDDDEHALPTIIDGMKKHRVGDEMPAIDDEGVIRHRDDTPLVCRGCRVRGTWRNAGHCCTICYKSYGRHHGYYCTQEVGSDINTKLHRAIDVMNPSIKWDQDHVDL
jgi:hypothetical protein